MNMPDELLPVIEWWEKDGKKHLAIGGCILLAGLAGWGFNAWRQSRAEAAAAALAGQVSGVEALEEAAAAYGGGKSGPALRLKLAAAYLARRDEGDAQKALEIYNSLEGAEPAGYEGVAKAGKAESLEALEDWKAAGEAYKSFIDSAKGNSTLLTAAKLGLARCQARNGDKKTAIEGLEALKKTLAEDAPEKAGIDATIDTIKRWTKREPAPAAEAKPAAPEIKEPAAETKPAAPAAETKPAAPAAETKPAAPAAEAKPAAPAPAKK